MGNLSRPLAEMIARLEYHATSAQVPARLLDGLKFYPAGIQRTEGQDDFPYCEFKGMTGGESYRGAGRVGLAQPSLILLFEIANKRGDGHPALMTWVEKVLDAIETDITGAVKPSLNGTRRPFDVAITQNFTLDASLNAVITVTVEPKIVERGKRRI